MPKTQTFLMYSTLWLIFSHNLNKVTHSKPSRMLKHRFLYGILDSGRITRYILLSMSDISTSYSYSVYFSLLTRLHPSSMCVLHVCMFMALYVSIRNTCNGWGTSSRTYNAGQYEAEHVISINKWKDAARVEDQIGLTIREQTNKTHTHTGHV